MTMLFPIILTAFAQANANHCGFLGQFSTLCNLDSGDFGLVVSTAINVVLILAVIIAIFYFMHGGIMWITSRGDKEKVESARNQIVSSLVGLIIAFLAFFIANVTLGFFFPGKNIKDLSLPTLDPDIISPTASITAPVSGSTVLGIATVQTTASDNKQVTKVEFYVDGILKYADLTQPYSFSWDTKPYIHNSTHSLLAKAYDAAGNVGATEAVDVTVVDITKPALSITYPVNNQKIAPNTSVTITASANDVSGVKQVEFSVNGISKCTDYAAPYTCIWQVPAIKGVIYRIETSGIDAAGNVGKSSNSVTSM
jgi:hypothetical protein